MSRRRKPSAPKYERQAAFLEALATGVTIRTAAAASGVGYTTAFEWRKADPEFADRWEDAYAAGTDVLEAEAHRRAVDGVDVPVYRGGAIVGTVKQYSDVLLIVLLKARDPKRYCERARTLALQWERADLEAERGRVDPCAQDAARDAIAALERIAAKKVALAATDE